MRTKSYLYTQEVQHIMLTDNAKQIVREIRKCLTTQPVEKAWIFGSFSRGEEREDSDVDILVEYDKSAKVSLFTISRIAIALKKAAGRNVDIIEDGCLLPFAANSANRDKFLIYERKSQG